MTINLDEPEGATPLTPDELEGLKVKTISTRGELNQLESENIIQGLTWLSRLPKRVDILTDDFARELHRRLYGDVWAWAGQYRLTDKNIGVQVWTISSEMRNCLNDVKIWIERGVYPPLEAAARLHHRLVWIHPFPNGNGRWSRVMADALLERLDDSCFIDWAGDTDLSVDSAHRQTYIRALRAADNYEFGPLVDFVEGVARKY